MLLDHEPYARVRATLVEAWGGEVVRRSMDYFSSGRGSCQLTNLLHANIFVKVGYRDTPASLASHITLAANTYSTFVNTLLFNQKVLTGL